MAENKIRIPTKDGYDINALHNVHGSDTLVIVMHGQPGSMHDAIVTGIVNGLHAQKIDSLRFNFYSKQEGDKPTRRLETCTLQDHADDIVTVLAYTKKMAYDRIYVIAHSFACLAWLYAAQQGHAETLNSVARVAFIEPAYDVGTFYDRTGFVQGEDGDDDILTQIHEFTSQVSREMIRQARAFNADKAFEAAKLMTLPLLLIQAEKSISAVSNSEHGYRFFRGAWGGRSYSHTVVHGSNHRFTLAGNEGKLNALLAEYLIAA